MLRFVVAMGIILAGTIESSALGQSEPKLTPALSSAIQSARASQSLPVYVLLESQYNTSRGSDSDHAARVAGMKRLAELSQRPILAHIASDRRLSERGDEPRSLWLVNMVIADVSPSLITQLARREDVRRIGLNAAVETSLVLPTVHSNNGRGANNCAVEAVRADEAWSQFDARGQGVLVAVIDTGCCTDHPDLRDRIWSNPGEIPANGIDDDANGYTDDVQGWNFAEHSNDLVDTLGHGTQVAGHVAGDGSAGTATGVAPEAELMILKWTGADVQASYAWEAFQYATDNGADVINASIGYPHNGNDDIEVWRMVVENSIELGVVVCAAGGNLASCCRPAGAITTPGDIPMAITVGATDCDDAVTIFSSRGPTAWSHTSYGDWPFPPGKKKPTVVAPGLDVAAPSEDCESYEPFSGASAATPHASGVAALLLSVDPDLDHHGVKRLILQNAFDLGAPGWDLESGAGRLDAFASVGAAIDRVGLTAAGICETNASVGTTLDGTSDELAAAEGQPLSVRSGSGTSFFDRHTLEVDVVAKTTRDNPSEIVVTTISWIDQPSGVGQLYLRNTASGEWDLVDAFAVGPLETTTETAGIDAPRYVAPDGTVEAKIKHTVFSPFFAFRFESNFDLVQLELR